MLWRISVPLLLRSYFCPVVHLTSPERRANGCWIVAWDEFEHWAFQTLSLSLSLVTMICFCAKQMHLRGEKRGEKKGRKKKVKSLLALLLKKEIRTSDCFVRKMGFFHLGISNLTLWHAQTVICTSSGTEKEKSCLTFLSSAKVNIYNNWNSLKVGRETNPKKKEASYPLLAFQNRMAVFVLTQIIPMWTSSWSSA